jgi:hypothetical protein
MEKLAIGFIDESFHLVFTLDRHDCETKNTLSMLAANNVFNSRPKSRILTCAFFLAALILKMAKNSDMFMRNDYDFSLLAPGRK